MYDECSGLIQIATELDYICDCKNNIWYKLVEWMDLPSIYHESTKGPMWGYPRLVLGALGSFLEPFCGHVLPKVDKIYSKLTFELPPRRALRGFTAMRSPCSVGGAGREGIAETARHEAS